MHLYTEARSIVLEAIEQVGTDRDECETFIWQSCDGHEVSIYYHKAIQFCAEQNTDAGEEMFEEMGGWQDGRDTFGSVACRIAFGTLYTYTMELLHEELEERN